MVLGIFAFTVLAAADLVVKIRRGKNRPELFY